MKKYWVGNRKKRYYGELWGNTIWGGGDYENPVRLSMCDSSIKIEKQDAYGWRGWTMGKYEPIARLNIWWLNMVKEELCTWSRTKNGCKPDYKKIKLLGPNLSTCQLAAWVENTVNLEL